MKQVINGKVYDDEVDELICIVKTQAIFKSENGNYYLRGFYREEGCLFFPRSRQDAFHFIQNSLEDPVAAHAICKREFPEYRLPETHDIFALGLKKITTNTLLYWYMDTVGKLLSRLYTSIWWMDEEKLIDIHHTLRDKKIGPLYDDFIMVLARKSESKNSGELMKFRAMIAHGLKPPDREYDYVIRKARYDDKILHCAEEILERKKALKVD